MDNLLSLIEQAEIAQENEQVNAMIAAREDYQNWMGGTNLAQAAASRCLQRRDSMREVVDTGR